MRLLPLGLSDMVPANHMARVVDEVVVSLDLTALRSLYPGGGAPAHDPRMMLKAVVYAYASGVCSSRKISEATRSNVYFLWLTGRTALDRMTVNRFRTERLRGAFEDIFTDAALMLAELGHVTPGTCFLDGTKIEADASKYAFTWRKSTEKNREKLRARVGAPMDEVDGLDDEGDGLFDGMPEPGGATADDVEEAARRISERLEGAPKGKALKKAKRLVEKDCLPRMRRCERDLADMGGRKSLSKTDRGAAFMRMKEDRMGNGQPKAGCNVQNGTENRFATHAAVHQRPGGTARLEPRVEPLKESLGTYRGRSWPTPATAARRTATAWRARAPGRS